MAEKKTPTTPTHPRDQFRGLEAKLVRLQKNPEKNEAEIKRLQVEAGRLLELIDRLERDELAKMSVSNPDEAALAEAELEPVIDEAEDIRRQLAELDAKELEISKEEADIDKKISELNTNTGDIPEVEIEDASIGAKKQRQERDKKEKKEKAEEEAKRKAWEEAQEEVKNALVLAKNSLDLMFKKSKASKRELAASITKAITFVIDKNVGLDNEQMVFLTTLRLDLGRVADNQFTSQLDGMSLAAKISEAQRQFNKVFEKTLKPATQTGSTGYRKDSKPEIEVVKEDKTMKLREGSVEDAKINLRVDPEFVNVLKELVLRNNSAVNVTVIMNENPVLKQNKKRAENVLRQMNEMGLFEPAETNGYKFLKIKKPKELEDKLAGYELEFDEVDVSKKVDEIIRTSLDGTRIESYAEVIQTLRELLGRIDPTETGDIKYTEDVIRKLSETYEEKTTQREETNTMTDIMNRYSQDNNPEQTLAELKAFQARGIRTEQVANAVDSFIKQIESLLAPEPDKKAKKKRKSQNPPGPAPAPADTEEAPNMDKESWILQEVDSFIAEFGLEEFLPTDFRKLKQEQQLKTIRDLKQRIVDIVKQDAKNQYSAVVKGEKSRSNIFGKILIGARELIQKERNIKNTEREQFENIKNTEEGRKIMAEQMKLLADINGGQEIILGKNGELLIDYTNELKIGDGSVQRAQREEYNVAANAFRAIPYEWSQGKEGSKERMAYEDARAVYDAAVEKVLEVKRFAPGKEPQAVKEMMELRNSLMLEQLLNTHPKIEIEFGKLGEGASREQVWETIRRLTGTQNRQNAALFATGYAARTITKATLGAIAMPIVGAVFGGVRAKFKAKETLVERRKDARYGGRDNSNEAEKVVDADKMANHIDNILNQLEQANISDEKRLALEKRLQIRIDVALEKIESGLLNFGNSKDALLNQYRLTENLNRALARSALFDETVRGEVSARTNAIMSFRESNIAEAQQKYIEEQILMGALRGAGIATAGYIVRAIGEEAGWWGGETPAARPYSEETADSKPFVDSRYVAESSPELAKAEEYVAQAEKHYKNAQEYYDNATGEDKQAALEALNGAKAELDFQRKYLEGVANGTIVATEAPVDSVKSPIKTDTITRQSTYTPLEKDTTITTTPETTVKSDSLEVASAKAREAQKVYEEALEKQRNAKTYGENASAETELARAKEESLSANKKLEETAKAYREQKNAPQSEQSEPAKRTPKTERPTTKAPKADKGEDRMTATEDSAGEEQKAGGGPAEEEKPKVNERPVKRVKRDTGSAEAKPRSVPSAPETKATVGDMDPNAVVGEGEGVTFAFKHQIEADPALGEALKKQIGYEGKIGTKAFYEALGKEFGYIKPNGEWIGVSEGDVAAYKFVKVGDSYKVYEYQLKGTKWEIVERHNADNNFEGEDYEKEYEYLNEPKRKPEVASGDEEENPQFAKPEDQTNRSLNTEQFAPPSKTPPLDENAVHKAQFAKPTNPPKTKSVLPDDNRIKTKTVSRTEKVIPTVEKGKPVVLESDKQDVKWTIEPGPPDGRPTLVEDFKLVGPKALRMFADRYGYENLTASQVDFVGQRYRFNLNKIFEKSSDWTDKWSKESATRLLRMDVGSEVKGNKEELSTYIKMLHDAVKASGKKMEPFNDGFVGNKETTKDYILRMLFELEKRGKLDAFNDKFDAFVEGASKPEAEVSVGDAADQIDFGKVYMYELWQRYANTPESLSEDELAFVEKTEALGKKLDSKSTTLEASETAEHYMKRLEGLVKSKSK